MRRLIGFFLVVWLCVWIGAPVCAQTEEDIQGCAKCMHCGMDRQQFAHCRMLLLYDDGSSQGTCSIHCAAVDLAVNIDRTPRSIKVGDYNTKKLVDAESAFWVLGGSKQGVMTRRAKWALKRRKTLRNSSRKTVEKSPISMEP